jgi:TolB protein
VCDRSGMMRVLSLLMLVLASPQAAAPPVSHGASPAVSPDGRWVAFTSERSGTSQLYVIAADGTGERQVTRGPQGAAAPQWTGDARRLRYAQFADNITHIFEVDPDGQHEREVVAVPGRSPRLTSDGTRVVYGGGTSWTATELMVAGVRDGVPQSPRMINDGKSVAWNAAWSPDGRRIAFTGRDPEGLQVFVVNADGTGLRQVTHHAKADGGAQVPAWSADGQWLAYQSNTADHRAWIWIVRADGTGARKVLEHTDVYLDETPSWFPDGGRLAFQSNRTGTMEIWIVNTDGTGLRQLTAPPG